VGILLSVKIIAQTGGQEDYSSTGSTRELAAATRAVADATQAVARSNQAIADAINGLARPLEAMSRAMGESQAGDGARRDAGAEPEPDAPASAAGDEGVFELN
jgi:hypothetical protein